MSQILNNLIIVKEPSDGACLFHCFKRQLNKKFKDNYEIRLEICNFIMNNIRNSNIFSENEIYELKFSHPELNLNNFNTVES